jgi:hypothetical protein
MQPSAEQGICKRVFVASAQNRQVGGLASKETLLGLRPVPAVRRRDLKPIQILQASFFRAPAI